MMQQPSGFAATVLGTGVVSVGLGGAATVSKGRGAKGWKFHGVKEALAALGICEEVTAVDPIFGGFYCAHCYLMIATPRPAQRFCSNSGKCRTAWHYNRRREAVAAIDGLTVALREAGDAALRLSDQVREAFHLTEEEDE